MFSARCLTYLRGCLIVSNMSMKVQNFCWLQHMLLNVGRTLNTGSFSACKNQVTGLVASSFHSNQNVWILEKDSEDSVFFVS